MSTGIGIGASMVFGGILPSPSFEYSAVSYCKNASNPTPTINGTPGGVFTAAPVAPSTGTLVINSSTGEVDIAASDPGNYLVTYTVGGVAESDPFQVVAMQTTGFSYSASSFEADGTATPTITGSAGGTFTSSPAGLSINSSTGVIDLGASTIGGPYTITYSNNGICAGTPSTFDVTITSVVRIIANNYALEFSGSDEYVIIGNLQGTALQPSNATLVSDGLSVSAWVKADPLGTYGVWQNDGLGQANYAGLLLQLNSGQVNIGYSDNSGSGSGNRKNYLTTSSVITAGTWHHIVAIYKGIGVTPQLYVDGTEITAFNSPTGTATTLGYSTSAKATIGTVRDAVSFFTGDIDEVAVWNKVLSASAVQEIYDATINNPGYCANLFKLANESSDPIFWNRMGD